jgi:hypothetical protein
MGEGSARFQLRQISPDDVNVGFEVAKPLELAARFDLPQGMKAELLKLLSQPRSQLTERCRDGQNSN